MQGNIIKIETANSTSSNITSWENTEKYFKEEFGLNLSNVYWGDLHSHTIYSLDSLKTQETLEIKANDPQTALQYGKEIENLSFVSLNDHAELENSAAEPEEYVEKGYNLWQAELDIERKFTANMSNKNYIIFPGWEYTNTHFTIPNQGITNNPDLICVSAYTSKEGYGHKNVVFKNLYNLPSDRISAKNVETARELWINLSKYKGNVITIPHTVSLYEFPTDWSQINPEFVRVVETYSEWGNFEGLIPTNNSCSIKDTPYEYNNKTTNSDASIRNILYERWVKAGNINFTFGLSGSTDLHAGRPGTTYPDSNHPSTGGIIGIASTNLTRDNLWNNLYNKHTLASSTSNDSLRLPILFAIEANDKDYLMGDLINTNIVSAKIKILVPKETYKIEILVDGCILYKTNSSFIDQKIILTPTRHYIYARAYMNNTEGKLVYAYTSPIYIGIAK
jgi:hypothetical protein